MTSGVVDVKIPVDESDITTGSTPSQPMTKSAVIDQELNRHGMSRYQWYAPLSYLLSVTNRFACLVKMLG